jgi:hypothetical protein
MQGLTQPLFPRGTKLGKTKILTFKTASDISFTVEYAPDADLPLNISPTILSANVVGVAEKIDKLKGNQECHDPLVKVGIKLTESGLVEVLHSEVQCEIREKKNLADKFMDFFGGGKEKEEKEGEAQEQVRKKMNKTKLRSFLRLQKQNLRAQRPRQQLLPRPHQPPLQSIPLKNHDMKKLT